jgi:hypothetical protein
MTFTLPRSNLWPWWAAQSSTYWSNMRSGTPWMHYEQKLYGDRVSTLLRHRVLSCGNFKPRTPIYIRHGSSTAVVLVLRELAVLGCARRDEQLTLCLIMFGASAS